jgi:hypothetical protein
MAVARYVKGAISLITEFWRASGPLAPRLRDQSFVGDLLGDSALPWSVPHCAIFHPSNLPFFHFRLACKLLDGPTVGPLIDRSNGTRRQKIASD